MAVNHTTTAIVVVPYFHPLYGPGQTYGVSAFVSPLIESFGWSRSLVSSLYSLGTLAAGVAVGAVGSLRKSTATGGQHPPSRCCSVPRASG